MLRTGNSENEFILLESLLILKMPLSYKDKISYSIINCFFMYWLFYAMK